MRKIRYFVVSIFFGLFVFLGLNEFRQYSNSAELQENNTAEIFNARSVKYAENTEIPEDTENTDNIEDNKTEDNKDEPWYQFILDLLDNNAIIVTLCTLGVSILAKTVISIFMAGRNDREKFASKEEQQIFENKINAKLSSLKDEVKSDVLKMCMYEIKKNNTRIDEIQKTANDIEITKDKIDTKIQALNDKYKEISALSVQVQQLTSKVNSIQYGQNSTTRRTGNGI